MFNVYQPWDPLRVCVVGRAYPPEFFSWVKNPRARAAMEKVSIESEEDFQLIIKKMESFGVEVLRPNVPRRTMLNGKHLAPPTVPRDITGMIGNVFYENSSFKFEQFYSNVRDPSWPDCSSMDEFKTLPSYIQDECVTVHQVDFWHDHYNCYDDIIARVRSEGNQVKSHVRTDLDICNRAQIYPMGTDLLVGTWCADPIHGRSQWKNITTNDVQSFVDQEFLTTRNHVIDTQGHADSSFCPVVPGLIVSLDTHDFSSLLPDWEIIHCKTKTSERDTFVNTREELLRKYYIPGFENDPSVIDLIENYLISWTGNSAETVFDVNIVNINEKNVLLFGENEEIFNALERRGITAHVIPFRHRWFWDGGIHCVTSDLHRDGTPQNFIKGQL